MTIEPPLAALSPDSDFVQACYIVAFSMFILGIRQGTHPTTARRGNLIAAGGMAIAVAMSEVEACFDAAVTSTRMAVLLGDCGVGAEPWAASGDS